MGLLGAILLFGLIVNVAVFLVMWNFRGRGFGELNPWRRGR